MRSTTPRALTKLFILTPMLLASAGCASVPIIAAPSSACSSLVPKSFRSPVPGADLPPLSGAVVGDWMKFGDAQTAQLDKANSRTSDALEIVESCEARDKATADRLSAPWWRRPFMPRG
jgi:hypothetical protein